MTPPRSVWVFFGLGGHAISTTRSEIKHWWRYDLHRPKKRKARKGERRSK